MSVLFVSHSSRDDVLVAGLEKWLLQKGFTDLFIDHSKIAGGEKWAQALRDASGACRVVICLVTENWLASDECFAEFKAAWYMGRRIIPLFCLLSVPSSVTERLGKVRSEDQGFDVVACVDTAGSLDLSRDAQIEQRLHAGLLAGGALTEVGLDPEAFAIDRKLRPTPFPGLTSYGDDDADAAVFYGRSREIAETLEELRQVRAIGDLRPFVILGASGAGKSSLLKAGIIPRLRREVPAWLPLRAFRPGSDPLLNFAEALAHSFADFQITEASGLIRDRLFDYWRDADRDKENELTQKGLAELDTALEAEGSKLRKAAGRNAATILISIDQAEEITRASGSGADALADYLRAALAVPTKWQLAFTIRTDSFPELQSSRRFQNLNARGYDLRALPVFRFDSVVENPAKRYGVTVEPDLVDALMDDAPKADALPLLAFALQRLWRQYSASKSLTAKNYQKIGGLKGLIEDAAERALRGLAPNQDTPLPNGPPPKQIVDLAASTFVPELVELNEQGGLVRHIAKWHDFSYEQRDLLTRFDQWRLMVRREAIDGDTVEVAHEALFREWSRLRGWLEPERARLDAIRTLQTDALTWDRNGRDAAFLNHRKNRLIQVVRLAENEAYRKRLTSLDFDYLSGCKHAERSSKNKVRLVKTLVATLAIVIAIGIAAWRNQEWLKERIYQVTDVTVWTATEEQALKLGDKFRECSGCPEMIVVPKGNFKMGSPTNQGDRSGREYPLHPVSMSTRFAVGKFPIVFDEWKTCVEHGDCDAHIDSKDWGKGQQPVINVTWEDARRYVEWLARITGKPYRLLSEAEYEYAARAGTESPYPWGPNAGSQYANCGECGTQWAGVQPAPAGSFLPNRFGLFDMVGNVAEMVEDCFHDNYENAPKDGSPWLSDRCVRHVTRGGDWLSRLDRIRSASRDWIGIDERKDTVGFRVARTLSP